MSLVLEELEEDALPSGLQETVEDREVAGLLKDALEDAIARTKRSALRLSYADTTVSFLIGDDAARVVLLLDRLPLAVREGDDPTEVSISLTADQARALSAGQLGLPCALLSGAVSFTGPVRRFLTVYPVLRHLLASDGHDSRPR